METFLKIIIISLVITATTCSIGGLNYMDPIIQRPLPNDARRNEGGDPCNPLYWYPRAVPEHCNQKPIQPGFLKDHLSPPAPIRVPVPVPSQPIPYPIPFLPPPMPMPYPMPLPPPPPIMPMPIPPLPYGIPIMPAGPMLPVGGLPMPAMAPIPGMFPGIAPAQFPPPPPSFSAQAGLVPGVPGLVSPEGGINIMPFSDAYSSMLEEHRQKMIRKHLEYVLKKYSKRANHGRSKRLRISRKWFTQ